MKGIAWCLAFLLCLAPVGKGLAADALETEGPVSVIREVAGESYVEIPVLTLENTFVNDSVNQAVRAALESHLNTLALLKAGTQGNLRVTALALILPSNDGHDMLSILFDAQGRMPNGRPGNQKIPLVFDLANAQALKAEALFFDVPEARDWLESTVYDALSAGLSNYLDLGALKPFPIDRFNLSGSGISFYYPDNSLVWLSGQSASIHFLYHELATILNLEEDSALYGLGVPGWLQPAGEADTQGIRDGRLPGLDVVLGEGMAALLERHPLQYDPEGFPEGEAYQLEDDRFRGTTLVSRDGETLSGILSRRMNLSGLITGQAERVDAVKLLGQPFITLAMAQAAAQLYGLPEGSMDTYRYDDVELRLYYNLDETLYAVWLTTTP